MDWFLILLRLVHIGAGIFWVGSAFAFFLFIQPAVRSLGPDTEGAFMGQLSRVQKFPMIILGSTILTIGAGLILYLRDAGGVQLWLGSATGVGFTIGAAAAILAFSLGPSVILPSIGRLDAIGQTLAAEHRPPTAEEGATIQAMQARLGTFGKVDLVLLGVAVLFMSTSRYLG
jgi:hypothetical protein